MPSKECCCQENTNEQELYAQLDNLLIEYKEKKGALIPVLQIAQNIFG